MKNFTAMPKMRLGFTMWLIGMVGVLSLLFILPALLRNQPISLPIWVVYLIQLVQSGIILAVAVWVGVAFAHKVNLFSPCIEALVTKKSFFEKLHPQLGPACLGGFIVGVLLIGMSFVTPHELLSVVTKDINPILKIFTEVLYGGVTEEILLRWGVMTLILWLLWRLIQANENIPSSNLVWIAIIASSLLFSLAHLPAAYILAGHLTFSIFAYVVVGNTVAGIMFGFLYQRFGLESAMIAHALAHLVADAIILVLH